MGFKIGCPYYQSDKRKTITCEGRLKYFPDREKKTGQMRNVCEGNWKNCKYYQSLQKVYNECKELGKTEAELKLMKFYYAEAKKNIKHLVQQMGIMEKNVSHNIQVKQTEIDKLRQALKISATKEGIALIELAAIMHKNGIEIVDFSEVTEFREKYMAEFVPEDPEARTARLVVKERGES